MIADPLSAPAVKLIVAEVSPGVMDVIVGAAGAAGAVGSGTPAAAYKSAKDKGIFATKNVTSSKLLTFVALFR